jgi:hypothetical protein
MNFLTNPVVPAANTPHVFSTPIAAGAIFFGPRRLILAAVLSLAALLTCTQAVASETFPELHVANAYRGGSDVYSISAAWHGAAPAWTRAARHCCRATAVDPDRAAFLPHIEWRIARFESGAGFHWTEFRLSNVVARISMAGEPDSNKR